MFRPRTAQWEQNRLQNRAGELESHRPLLLQLCSRLHVVKVQASPVADVSPAALLPVRVRSRARAPRVVQEVPDGLVSVRLRRADQSEPPSLPPQIRRDEEQNLDVPAGPSRTLLSSPSLRSSSRCSDASSPPTPGKTTTPRQSVAPQTNVSRTFRPVIKMKNLIKPVGTSIFQSLFINVKL